MNFDQHAGGAIPLIKKNREIHVFDGTTYKVDVTWCRYGFEVAIHSPRIPRRERRRREAEAARRAAETARYIAHLTNDTYMASPSGRPGWLSEFQDWPCARCGQQCDASAEHLCKPLPGWGDPDKKFAKYSEGNPRG